MGVFLLCGESFVPVSVPSVASVWWSAGKSSPCVGCLCLDRDNFLPARVKRAEMGVFLLCGESFVPVGACVGACPESFVPWVCAAWLVCGGLREKVLPARVVCVSTGIIFSLLASKGPKWVFFAVRGEFCTGCGHAYRVRGEFCTGCGHAYRVRGESCTGCGHAYRVPGEFCTVGVRCVASVWWFARKFAPLRVPA